MVFSKRSKTNRRPPLPRTAREIMQYDQKLAMKGGVKGGSGVGSTSGILGKLIKGAKGWTPVGVATGFYGGQVSAYRAMIKRQNEHDKTVDYHRNKKN